jgi:hypothetical protein
MTIDSTTHIVPSHEVNLVLNVKVHNTNDAVRAHQTIDRVDDRVKLGYHAERITHRDKLSTTSVGVLVEVANGLTLRDHFFALVRLRFVLVETEGAGILAYDSYVCPPKASEALAGLEKRIYHVSVSHMHFVQPRLAISQRLGERSTTSGHISDAPLFDF